MPRPSAAVVAVEGRSPALRRAAQGSVALLASLVSLGLFEGGLRLRAPNDFLRQPVSG